MSGALVRDLVVHGADEDSPAIMVATAPVTGEEAGTYKTLSK